MGKNLDLIDMLGLPEKIQCPHCKVEMESYYDDHDIQCSTEYDKGHWKIHRCCEECEKKFTYEFQIRIEQIQNLLKV